MLEQGVYQSLYMLNIASCLVETSLDGFTVDSRWTKSLSPLQKVWCWLDHTQLVDALEAYHLQTYLLAYRLSHMAAVRRLLGVWDSLGQLWVCRHGQ